MLVALQSGVFFSIHSTLCNKKYLIYFLIFNSHGVIYLSFNNEAFFQIVLELSPVIAFKSILPSQGPSMSLGGSFSLSQYQHNCLEIIAINKSSESHFLYLSYS